MLRHALAIAATVMILCPAVAMAQQPYVDVAAQASADGLFPVRNTDVENVWMRPDAGIAFYTSIMVRPVRISYQPARPATEDRPATIVPARDRLNAASVYLGNAMIAALAEHSGYRVVAEPEVGTLELEPSITGLVAYAEEEDDGGMVPLDSVADMRLVTELRDAYSGHLLVEASDSASVRKAFPGQDNAEAVKKLFDDWAMSAAERLAKVRMSANQLSK